MQQYTGKVKKSELNLREHLSVLERDWLSACLVSNVGVKGAIYSDKDPHHLVVEYDSNLMNTPDLLDILYRWGLRAELRTADCTPTGTLNFGRSARFSAREP